MKKSEGKRILRELGLSETKIDEFFRPKSSDGKQSRLHVNEKLPPRK